MVYNYFHPRYMTSDIAASKIIAGEAVAEVREEFDSDFPAIQAQRELTTNKALWTDKLISRVTEDIAVARTIAAVDPAKAGEWMSLAMNTYSQKTNSALVGSVVFAKEMIADAVCESARKLSKQGQSLSASSFLRSAYSKTYNPALIAKWQNVGVSLIPALEAQGYHIEGQVWMAVGTVYQNLSEAFNQTDASTIREFRKRGIWDYINEIYRTVKGPTNAALV